MTRIDKIMIVFCFFVFSSINTQAKTNNYIQFDGLVIDSVIIENRNIYDLSEDKYDNFLFRTANKLHLKTKQSIIKQELLFDSGDKFNSQLASETERNLRQNLIIYDAYLLITKNTQNKLIIRVVTVDQWSLIGSLNFKRESNLNSFNILVEERNFLGFNRLLSLNYFSEPIEKDYLNISFLERRLFFQPLRLSWFYSNSNVNKTNQFAISHPYYNLQQSYTYSLNFGFSENILTQYYDDIQIARTKFDSDYFGLNFAYRFGSYDKKIKFSGSYNYKNKMVLYQQIIEGAGDLVDNVFDSLTHGIGFGVNLNTYNYLKLKQVDGYSYVEDFNVGYQASLFLIRKYNREFKQVNENRIITTVGYSGFEKKNLYSLYVRNSVWVRQGNRIRNFSQLKLSWYNINSKYMTFILRGRYDYNWSQDNSDILILSGITDLRGYPKYYKTGNKRIVFNFETRFFLGLELLSVNIGTALFSDVGMVWKYGKKILISDFKSNLGAGLRFYPERVSNNSVVRLDFSYSKEFDWSVSINSHHYFNAL